MILNCWNTPSSKVTKFNDFLRLQSVTNKLKPVNWCCLVWCEIKGELQRGVNYWFYTVTSNAMCGNYSQSNAKLQSEYAYCTCQCPLYEARLVLHPIVCKTK